MSHSSIAERDRNGTLSRRRLNSALLVQHSFTELVHTAIPTPVIPTHVLAAHFSKIHALEHFIYKQSTVGLTLRLKAT